MSALELFQRAQASFDDRVDAVGADQWDLPTKLPGWSVHRLVEHLVTEQLWAPPLLAGEPVAEVGTGLGDTGPLGNDPYAAWQAASDASLAAFATPGALESSVELSYGTTPSGDYLAEMIADLVVHSYDLARAIDGVQRLDPALVDWTLDYAREHLDPAGLPGVFAPGIAVDSDGEPQVELLARYGRR